MAIHEIGLDAEFQDIRRFTANILQEAESTTGSERFAIKAVYWNTTTQVLLARKVDLALEYLAKTIAASSSTATNDAQAATTQARRMVFATWGLVGATLVLAVTTGLLVFYTRALVDAAPTFIAVPNPPLVTRP